MVNVKQALLLIFSSGIAYCAGQAKLDAAERHHVIVQAAENLKQHYIDHEVGNKMASSLLSHEKSGDYTPSRIPRPSPILSPNRSET